MTLRERFGKRRLPRPSDLVKRDRDNLQTQGRDDWQPRVLPKAPPPGDALGWLTIPIAPTTWENESGMPILISTVDDAGRMHKVEPTPTQVGQPTRGWDDDTREWCDFTVSWDGSVPEAVRWQTPGHSKGLLLAFYPTSAILRSADAKLVPTRDTTFPTNPVVPRKKKRSTKDG